ncbi:MAG: PIN domain-containing protein [Candidatus Omnitrophica bacterium]|nr:PIN domain-containing protein [Candidatus Omnitrophota bacterium]
MGLIILRLFFVIIASFLGYHVGEGMGGQFGNMALVGVVCGFVGAALIVILEIVVRRVSVKGLSAAVFGLLFGLIMAKLMVSVLTLVPMTEKTVSVLQVVLILTFCYLGMVMALRGKDEFSLIIPYVKLSRQNQSDEIVILDTSVIIDGRIADIFQTRFIEGRVIIPRFVLNELQQIADSQDSLKRTRGRRGLDVLNRIKKIPNIEVKIHEEDYPEIPEVDAKLVKLAKSLESRILTNDYNLNKIAELQGVTVLNINELSNAIKPVVLPGEKMTVKLIKEGKEHNQAIAYLDDGTMIVVEEARNLIGKTLDITVTSVLQTSAGRMIFGKFSSSK